MQRLTSPPLSRRSVIALGISALLFSTAVRAAEAPINTLKNSAFGGKTDTAINGYDSVAYFTVQAGQRAGRPRDRLDGREMEVLFAGQP